MNPVEWIKSKLGRVTEQSVKLTYPPNYDKIRAKFPAARNYGVLFCYGGTLHNPSGVPLTPDLLVHESIHSAQQGEDPEAWWDRYIDDKAFRASQEIPAYAAQYAFIVDAFPRDIRRKALNRFASALSGPLYGRMMTKAQAKEAILSIASDHTRS